MAFDLNAVIAEQPKARGKKRFSFTFDGKEYVLPNEIDGIGLDAAINGEVVVALRRHLTEEQYRDIQASVTTLTHATIRAVLDAYYDHVTGLKAGESAASSRSSKSTARPSKRTSAASTRARGSGTSVRKR